MSASRVFTVEELAPLKEKDNLHLLIEGKVYAIADFVDEHPGGDEVLYGEAGKDATEAFEDVGHSDEAREILEKYLVGTCDAPLKKGPPNADASARAGSAATSSSTATSFVYLLPLTLLIAFVAYRYATNP